VGGQSYWADGLAALFFWSDLALSKPDARLFNDSGIFWRVHDRLSLDRAAANAGSTRSWGTLDRRGRGFCHPDDRVSPGGPSPGGAHRLSRRSCPDRAFRCSTRPGAPRSAAAFLFPRGRRPRYRRGRNGACYGRRSRLVEREPVSDRTAPVERSFPPPPCHGSDGVSCTAIARAKTATNLGRRSQSVKQVETASGLFVFGGIDHSSLRNSPRSRLCSSRSGNHGNHRYGVCPLARSDLARPSQLELDFGRASPVARIRS